MVQAFCSVYGPVLSWRYGQSLGIDPIGTISTCSFDCVYCQLGAIQQKTIQRQVFVPTTNILQDLQSFSPWAVDAITVSGSGEPTLALNLEEILRRVKALTGKPIGVLTNGSLLFEPQVQRALAVADQVAIKVDAVRLDSLMRVNRAVAEVDLEQIWQGIQQFRQQYQGQLAIQTMLLSNWNEPDQERYIALMQHLAPHEIQLNTPTRPKPLSYEVEARGNHTVTTTYPTRRLKQVSREVLRQFGDRIYAATHIPVRYPAVEA